MMLIYVILVGSIIGFIVSHQCGGKMQVYAPVGVVGAFIGALLSFGDDPFLIRHPYLNPWTLSVIASALLVTFVCVLDRKVLRRYKK